MQDTRSAEPTEQRTPLTPAAAMAITTMGRFAVSVGGRAVALPAGLPTQAVKYVVACGGRTHAEALMDALWPEAGIEEGRKGVRNVLGRLARVGALVLVRDGEAIRIADQVSIDALAFRTAADRVLLDASRSGATEGARFALARYGGDFLPDDHYSDWAEAPRHGLRRRRLALVDLLAADARRRGRALEAIALLELAIEIDPVDEVRYLEVADLLIAAGRRAPAAAYLASAREVLRDHGLLPDHRWCDLQARLGEERRIGSLPQQ